MQKYIFISGGVISGIGKGIASSAIAVILKSYGFKVTMMKADPYLNVDAGTMNPLEHGETFVLEDGFETDMDIGTYERYTGEIFSRNSSLTSGAIFEKVIKDERSLAYEGKWVSIDYHVPVAIVDWIKKLREDTSSDIILIEIGGTVGEIGNGLFLEANRLLKNEFQEDVLHIHLSYLPVPSNIGEMKTKTVQMSVKELISFGISPNILLARASSEIDKPRLDKLSMFCSIKPSNVFSAPDVNNIYEVVTNFSRQGVGASVLSELNIKRKKGFDIDSDKNELIVKWNDKVKGISKLSKDINIGIVAKYFKSGNFDLKDSYASVIEAIRHASWHLGVNAKLHWIVSEDIENGKYSVEELSKFDGILVPQGWGSRGIEGKLKAVQYARENKIPYLGLCFGMQMAVIEYARTKLGYKDANTQEGDPKSSHQVIHLMDNQIEKLKKREYGGTIRLGGYPCVVKENTVLEGVYKKYSNNIFPNYKLVNERHRHRYEFNNQYRTELENAGLILSGLSPDGNLVEAIELPKDVHPFFVGTQYHPELKSHFIHPHPIFLGYLESMIKRTK